MSTVKQDGTSAVKHNVSENGTVAESDKKIPADAHHASGREINDYYCEGNAPDEEGTDHYSVGGDNGI
ncbi:MAG: hypothetical protein ACXVPQ_02830 [Bacteroidia bacterium]